MYPVAVMNFLFMYWVYKFLILKHYRKTSAFNHQMPMDSITYFKAAFYMHVIWTIFMFSETNLLTVNVSGYVGMFGEDAKNTYDRMEKEIKDKLQNVSAGNDNELLDEQRLFSGAGFVYCSFLCLLIVFALIRYIILKFACKIEDDYEPDPAGYSIDYTKDIRIEPLNDVYIKAVKDLEDTQNTQVSSNFPPEMKNKAV